MGKRWNWFLFLVSISWSSWLYFRIDLKKRWQTVVFKFEPEFEALNIKDIFYLQHFQFLEYWFCVSVEFLFAIIRMTRFWSLKILFQSNPQQAIPNCRWNSIKESYISFIAAIVKYLFSLFITRRVRDISFAIFEEWDFQYMFSLLLVPENWTEWPSLWQNYLVWGGEYHFPQLLFGSCGKSYTTPKKV